MGQNITKQNKTTRIRIIRALCTEFKASPLSVKPRGKFSALRINQYFQSPFSSEFSQFFLHGHFTDLHKRPSKILRVPRRFSSAELGGNRMAAIDDFNIKLHLSWQFLCYNSVIEMNYILTCKHMFMSFSFSLSLRFTWNSKTVIVIMLSMNPCFLSTGNSMYTYM